MKTEYKVISAPSIEDLVALVNFETETNWKPCGGMIFIPEKTVQGYLPSGWPPPNDSGPAIPTHHYTSEQYLQPMTKEASSMASFSKLKT
jgi:hypothetical protein